MTDTSLRDIVESVRVAHDGDLALAFRMVILSDGVLRAVGMELVGDPVLERVLGSFEGLPSQRWHIDLATMPTLNRWIARDRESLADDVRAETFAAFGLGSQLGCLVMVRGHLWGWIGALRRSDRPAFPGSGADRALPEAELVQRIAAVDTEPSPSQAVRAVIRDGEVLFAEPAALEVLGVADRLAEASARLGDPVPGVFRYGWAGGVPFHATGMVHPGGDRAWMLVLEPRRRQPITVLLSLSPAQRRVAELAASGATVSEIARALDRSEGTVKTHLRRVYDATGVATRAELLELVQASLPPG